MGSVNNISNNLLQLGLYQGTGLTNATVDTSTTGTGSASPASQSDTERLSPLAKLLTELQQLQQSDPSKYQDVTKQIAAKLQTAADTDKANGDTKGAAQLSQLASDFTTASSSGQLPNIQDLAKAVQKGGHHHHHGGPPPAAAASDDSSSATTNSAASSSSAGSSSLVSQGLSQLLSAYKTGANTGATKGDSTNPLSIISSTLSSAL